MADDAFIATARPGGRNDEAAAAQAAARRDVEADPWKILIVDDEPDVHRVTEVALEDFRLDGRRLAFLHAYSGQEALRTLAADPGIAVVLLDVVMEADDAGLELATRIRDELHNSLTRLVLRTGQSGMAPQLEVIARYDIHDYVEKAELTSPKLTALMYSCLRSYRDVKASREKSMFVSNMSHEFRTPLNAIIGYTELMLEEHPAADPPLAADLRKVLSAAVHLLNLVNTWLDIAKIEAGQLAIVREAVEVERLVETITDLSRPLAARNANALVVELEPRLGVMRTDSLKLQQCLVNLLSNACKFTRQGTVTLHAVRLSEAAARTALPRLRPAPWHDDTAHDWIRFQVADTGIGMTAEQQNKLFQPFSQADATIARQFGGTGLGLALTKHLCEHLGGQIQVDSAVGTGTTFWLWMPTGTAAEA